MLFHDLRRSGVRDMMQAGIQRVAIKLVTGHLTDSVVERYGIQVSEDAERAVRVTGEWLKEKAAEREAGRRDYIRLVSNEEAEGGASPDSEGASSSLEANFPSYPEKISGRLAEDPVFSPNPVKLSTAQNAT